MEKTETGMSVCFRDKGSCGWLPFRWKEQIETWLVRHLREKGTRTLELCAARWKKLEDTELLGHPYQRETLGFRPHHWEQEVDVLPPR